MIAVLVPYRDFNQLWLVSGYEHLGHFSSEEDAQAAIALARAHSAGDQVTEYLNRQAAARGAAKREAA